MATMKIEDAERVGEVNGEEVVPVSKGGAPKSMTAAQLKEYVMVALSQSTDSEIDFDTDRIVVSRKTATGNHVVRVDAVALAEAVLGVFYGRAVGKEEIDGTWMVTVGNADEKKSVSLADLAEWVCEEVGPEVQPFDIKNLESRSIPSAYSQVFIAFSGLFGSVRTQFKASIAEFLDYIKTNFFAGTVTEGDASPDDKIVVGGGGGSAIRYFKTIKLSSLGIGKMTKRPNAETGNDGKIAQFDGDDGKQLKGTLSVTNEITAESTTSEIPSAAAVKSYADNKASEGGDVKGPSSSSEGRIATFASGTGKALSDSGRTIVNEIVQNPSNDNVPTSKAVADAIANATEDTVKASGEVSSGMLASFGDSARTVVALYDVTDSMDMDNPSRTAIPTEHAVVVKMKAKCVAASSSFTDGHILVADGDEKQAKSGPAIAQGAGNQHTVGTNASVPTTKYVDEAIYQSVNGVSPASSAPSIVVVNGSTGGRPFSKCVSIGDLTLSDPSGNFVPTMRRVVNDVSSGVVQSGAISTEQVASPRAGAVRLSFSNGVASLHVFDEATNKWYVFETTKHESEA